MTEAPTPASASVLGVVLADQVILYRHKHGTDLIAATGENAMKLVKNMFNSSERLKAVLAKVEAIQAQPEGEAKQTIRGHLWFWRAMRELLTHARDDTPTPALNRLFHGNTEGDPMVIPDEWVTELLTWLAVNDERAPRKVVESLAACKDADAASLELTAKMFASLAFLAPVRERVGAIVFLSSEALETVSEYRDLIKDKWKPEAIADPKRACNVVGRYIRFLNDLDGNAFELESVSADADGYEFYVY